MLLREKRRNSSPKILESASGCRLCDSYVSFPVETGLAPSPAADAASRSLQKVRCLFGLSVVDLFRQAATALDGSSDCSASKCKPGDCPLQC